MARLIVVSNRLSFSLVQQDGATSFLPSAGGLATALSSYLERKRAEDPDFECLWVGWPGAEVDEGEREEVRKRALAEYQSVPVFLGSDDVQQFYDGFSNSTLWPVFHYFPSYAQYSETEFDAYRRVNQAFADAVLEVVRPGDVVWVHDY